MVTVKDMCDVVEDYTGKDSVKKSEIISKIYLIISVHAGVELHEITPDKSLTSDLGLD